MIGQKRLQDTFKTLIENECFPRFCMITGQTGSGKKTICQYIIDCFKQVDSSITGYTLPDIKIDTIRDMIAFSYKAVTPIVYIIPDADGMSVQAKNSLLKITEEPPNNAYFVMTLESPEMTLDTIRSRASIFSLDNYTEEDIRQYALRHNNLTPQDLLNSKEEFDIIKEICDVPGDVDTLYSYNPKEFYQYVEKVIDNVDKAEQSNVFKIADKLALKQDSEGYDLKLFLRAFMAICIGRIELDPLRYATGISLTGKYMSQLRIRGVSKQMLFDSWILEIRKYWTR